MGCGKSTLGKKLANKLYKSFFDLDDEIERSEGFSINELFEKYGEDYFRKKEKEILADIILNNESFVMSVGGGTPCFYDNMGVIKQSGSSIYLKYNAGILTSRLINAKSKRPLVKNLSEIELKVFIQNKLNEREEFYLQADFILEKNNLRVEDLIELN
ncbi:MAG: shikimate kinase [Flavobacteriales bacterium]|nr:MAG: shikimate kinase [Flavobacteriales bacterium]